MSDAHTFVVERTMARSAGYQPRNHGRIVPGAWRLFRRAATRGWLGQQWARMGGRAPLLLDLTSVATEYTVTERHFAGLCAVPLRQIRGSEGRCLDFDAAFHPLQYHTEARWLSIASAWHDGVSLPRVELIQIGDVYFVRDGHHRVSVARALGHEHIDAIVTAWTLSTPCP